MLLVFLVMWWKVVFCGFCVFFEVLLLVFGWDGNVWVLGKIEKVGRVRKFRDFFYYSV